MQQLNVDSEFKFFLPELDEESFAGLEEEILQYGVRDAIVVWEGTVIDGHHRFAIAMKHGLPFPTVEVELGSRDEALIWIIKNQFARRSLKPFQTSFFRGMHYNADKRIVTNAAGRNQHSGEVEAQNGPQPRGLSTAEKLARQYSVSRNTIKRDAQVAEVISAIGLESPEAKRSILNGTAGITRKQLQELSAGPVESVREVSHSIQDGTFERPRPARNGFGDEPGIADPALAAIAPLNAHLISVADGFAAGLRRSASHSSEAGLKAALRAHIDVLEELYLQM